MALYSSSQAAKAAGVSGQTIRNLTTGPYGSIYAGLWSPGVTPGKGSARLFTERDIAMLRFIRSETNKGRPHADIAQDIRGGALDDLPPEEDQAQGEGENIGEGMPNQPPLEQQAAMVLYGSFRALQDQLAESRSRETELNERLIEAEGRARAAEREAEILRDELAERRKGLIRRLFGR